MVPRRRSGLPDAMFAHAIALTYSRYAMVSVIALAVDMLVFFTLLHVGMVAMAASALGYLVGVAVHWILSSRLVFRSAAASRGVARLRQKSLFLGSALIGLALTAAVVGLGEAAGLMPLVAKCAAVVVSFQATYIARKALVFAS